MHNHTNDFFRNLRFRSKFNFLTVEDLRYQLIFSDQFILPRNVILYNKCLRYILLKITGEQIYVHVWPLSPTSFLLARRKCIFPCLQRIPCSLSRFTLPIPMHSATARCFLILCLYNVARASVRL